MHVNPRDKDLSEYSGHNVMLKLDRWRNDLTYKLIIIPSTMEIRSNYTNLRIRAHVEILIENYNEFCEFFSDQVLTIEEFVHHRYCKKEELTSDEKKFMLSVKHKLKKITEKFKFKHNGSTLDEVWYKTVNSTSEKIVLNLDAIQDIIAYLIKEARIIRRAAIKCKIIRYYHEFLYKETIFHEKHDRMMAMRTILANLGFFDSLNNTGTLKTKSNVISNHKHFIEFNSKWVRYREVIAHVGSRYNNETTPSSSISPLIVKAGYDLRNSSLWSNCNTELESDPSFAKLVDTRPENYNWLSNIREHANNNPIIAFSSISIAIIGLVTLISIILKKFTRRKRNYIPAVQIDDV
ncbi:hypothetical protein THOM_1599 [Trachipleistophora hominis]|uniref:Uncharacterized protein n=1 Tax=Trachipleistophora hominis TaxID=72359 RepID=L7JVE4_TRAHO|nr:hypothetical protein THOM_1599 [Trachipleistophora hominis]